MRKAVFFSLLLLLTASACKKSIEYETLAGHWPVFGEVYALKDSTPDSALTLMRSVADTLDVDALEKQSTFLLSEYQVLYTEVLYKNYGLRLKDTMAFTAFRFYDSVMPGTSCFMYKDDLCFRKARSYYDKAVVEEILTCRHIAAFSDYLNALWVMDGLMGNRRVFPPSSIKNVDYEHFRGLIFDRLAWFLYTYDAWDTSLECLEKSSECFAREDNAKGVAANLELMGDVMLAQGDKMGAYEIAVKRRIVNIYQHFCSLIHRALDLYNSGEKKASADMLLHALSISESPSLKRQVHFALGYFYCQEIYQPRNAIFGFDSRR